MTIAFVLGNGVSRQAVCLDQLRPLGKIYGCNALYRDFTPDVLISTDRPIATAIQQSGYSSQHRFHTRRPVPGLGAHPVPAPYFGYSSGPIAAGLAAIDGHQKIYLIGFDLGPGPANTINNLYAGTEFYKPVSARPTYTGNWVKQLIKIASDHKFVQFVRVVGATTAEVAEFAAVKNFTHVDLLTFVDRINNTKDL